jgi:hypothetical protein
VLPVRPKLEVIIVAAYAAPTKIVGVMQNHQIELAGNKR